MFHSMFTTSIIQYILQEYRYSASLCECKEKKNNSNSLCVNKTDKNLFDESICNCSLLLPKKIAFKNACTFNIKIPLLVWNGKIECRKEEKKRKMCI